MSKSPVDQFNISSKVNLRQQKNTILHEISKRGRVLEFYPL